MNLWPSYHHSSTVYMSMCDENEPTVLSVCEHHVVVWRQTGDM